MSPELLLAIGSVIVNGAVTWGVLSTKLDFLRRDVDHAHKRLDSLSDRMHLRQHQ
ncbi:hypothetical protein SRS16CHR_02717 [Variovorax sp. SRS16]|nr:hypothetical protein SRS16CHR_02717 [Variovorax sp. SRS16]